MLYNAQNTSIIENINSTKKDVKNVTSLSKLNSSQKQKLISALRRVDVPILATPVAHG